MDAPKVILTFDRSLRIYPWSVHRISWELCFWLTDTMATSWAMPFGRMSGQMMQSNHLYYTFPLRCQVSYSRRADVFPLYQCRLNVTGDKDIISMHNTNNCPSAVIDVPVNTSSSLPGRSMTRSVALYWSPCAWRPIIIGLVQPGTNRGIFLHRIGSRNTVPPRILRIVPFGLSHIFFSLNSKYSRIWALLAIEIR